MKTDIKLFIVLCLFVFSVMMWLAQTVKDSVAEKCDEDNRFVSHGTIYECNRQMIGDETGE